MQDKRPLRDEKSSPLADRLASISLDSAPPNPGQLMYECGYAAGLAARRGHTLSRLWQTAAVVAVLVVGGLAGRWTAPSAPRLSPPTIAEQSDVANEEVAHEEIVQVDRPPMGRSRPADFSMVDHSRVLYAAMSLDQLYRIDQLPSQPVTEAVDFAPARPLMVGGGSRLLQSRLTPVN